MGSRTFHLCMDIRGYLMNHTRSRDYEQLFRHDDGRFMTPNEAKSALMDELVKGRRVLPMADMCEGFDYETGCPGHWEEAERGE